MWTSKDSKMIEVVAFILVSTFAVTVEGTTRDERGLLDPFMPTIVSKAIGGTVGVLGQFWGKQENKKCYYYWGYGFSGPRSSNPERWNDEKFDQDEEGGLLNAASDAVAFAGNAWQAVSDETLKESMCLGYGMGYKTQQPGYPNKPGTCPGSRYCNPGQGQLNPQVVHLPGPQTYIQGRTPGYTTITNGSPGYTTTTNGSPGYTTTTIGSPGYTTTTNGSPGYTTTTIGSPSYTTTRNGSPGYTTTTNGSPSYTTTTQGFPSTTQQFITTTQNGSPPTCSCPCRQ